MKLYFLVCAMFILSSCSSSSGFDPAYRIIVSHSKKMKKRHNLFVEGTGGSMPKKIKSIFISYVACQRADIADARKLFIDITESLLNDVNQSLKIRPVLDNYPFESRNLEIHLGFEKSINEVYDDGSVAFVLNNENKICYQRYDSKTRQYITIHRETYEEALNILKSDPIQTP